ncbi:E3 ubiquitin-protein ligase RNF186 [Pithys albifrons albifrons]|uniref:E3 ubiquitin-protein ligase RNF186 n=1 Tax=Pithys albifrons albifrons TaxID=3385563 RepID=UPI003A5CC693
MEKSTDKPNREEGWPAQGVLQAEEDRPAPVAGGAAEMSRAGSLTQNTKHGKTVGFAEECMGTAERPSGTEPDSPAASKPAILEGENPHSKPLAVPTNRDCPKTCTLEMNHQGSTTSTDMDCLICFNNYNIYRVPKLLDCQHTFCAVCLKLILRKEKNTWIITCPLCRKPTWVSEGLIRTLPNKEDILEHLEDLEWNPEVHIPAKGLDSNSWAQSSQDILNTEDISADSSLAVQRLVLLLLLGVILTIIILPFVYLGRVKWVICLLLTLGLVMSLVLCCTPKFHCRCKRDSPTSCDKEVHVITIA